MAKKLTTYKKIQNVRTRLKNVYPELKKIFQQLTAESYLTKAVPKLALLGSDITKTFNSAEKNLVEAHRAANALGGIKSVPKASKFSASGISGSNQQGIKVKIEESRTSVNSLKPLIEELDSIIKESQKAYDEIENLSVLEQFVGNLDIIDYLYPVAGMGIGISKVIIVKNSGTMNLKEAKKDISNIRNALNKTKKALEISIDDFAKCEDSIKRRTYDEVLATTGKITEESNTSKKDIEAQIAELEKKQQEYVLLYGVECQEIAEEIARLKELIITECNVPLYGQTENYTCGSASASMILASLGVNVSESEFWKRANSNGEGTYVYRIKDYLNYYLGHNAYTYAIVGRWSLEDYAKLITNSLEKGYPVQVQIKFPKSSAFGYYTDGHYVVVTGIYQNSSGEYMVKINDPYSARGVNSPQQLEMKLSDLQSYGANHPNGGYVIYHKG